MMRRTPSSIGAARRSALASAALSCVTLFAMTSVAPLRAEEPEPVYQSFAVSTGIDLSTGAYNLPIDFCPDEHGFCSYGVGVERILPVQSPAVAKVEIKMRGHVRRSRLYYLRELRGKKARLRSKVRDLSALLVREEDKREAGAEAPEPAEAAEEVAGDVSSDG